MEKFDELMREKLEERKIVPSQNAWEKISEQLPAERKGSNTSKYILMLAACFVGLIVLTITFWISEGPSIEPQLEIVDKAAKDAEPILETKEAVVIGLPEEKPESIKETTFEVVNSQEATAVEPEEESQEINTLAFATEKGELLEQPTLDAIELKAKEVLAAVEEMESSSNTTVSDTEIDALLRAAQREIFVEKNIISEEGVDAMALLNEVEQELDGTFRDQIFDALKEGYLKLRTAVADRNN